MGPAVATRWRRRGRGPGGAGGALAGGGARGVGVQLAERLRGLPQSGRRRHPRAGRGGTRRWRRGQQALSQGARGRRPTRRGVAGSAPSTARAYRWQRLLVVIRHDHPFAGDEGEVSAHVAQLVEMDGARRGSMPRPRLAACPAALARPGSRRAVEGCREACRRRSRRREPRAERRKCATRRRRIGNETRPAPTITGRAVR